MMEKVNGVFDFSTVSFVNDDWAALVIIVELLLLTINAVVYRRNLVLSIQSLYSKRSFSQVSKEGKFFSDGMFIFSVPFVLIAWSLSILQLCSYFFPKLFEQLTYMQAFAYIAAFLAAFILLKVILNFLLFEFFECSETRYDFHVLGFSFLLNCSLALMLGHVVVQNTNFYPFYYFILLIFIGLYMLKIYKDFILKSKRVNLFQFFMYFCTLEILPCLVIVKLLYMFDNQGFLAFIN
ncbi:MAG: DUF4271 domain-containing protein [Bacteroidales bacterium]|nr:DUF4271 domain-containing protein [Bacteroidales bacterium]